MTTIEQDAEDLYNKVQPLIREFESGATRDTIEGKPDYSGFLSAEVMQTLYKREEQERAIAWAAGLFEGEGCIYSTTQKPPQPRLQIRMCDRGPLDRFCLIVGRGKVHGPYKTHKTGETNKGNWRDNYSWQVHGQQATEVARLIFPYLEVRRATRMMEVFSICRVQSPAFMGADVIKEFGNYMLKHQIQADGSMRESNNWKKGIPLEAYMVSMWRHLQTVWLHHEGRSDLTDETLEDALCGVIFNASGYLHELLKEKLND